MKAEALHRHDWQEAVFAVFSRSGTHLAQPEFEALVRREYDHYYRELGVARGPGRQVCPD